MLDALKHVGAHINNASVDHAEGARGSGAKVEHATAIEWAAIVYCYDDAAAGLLVRDADPRPERQSLVGGGEPAAAARIVGRHPEKRVCPGLPGLRTHGYGRNERRHNGDRPTLHTESPDDDLIDVQTQAG
jgi:hypothetical protein